MESTYYKTAGLFGILAGIAGFLYSVAFVVLKNAPLYSFLLMLGGIFTTVLLVELYHRVVRVDGGMGLLAFVFSATAAIGSAIHGAYDLANALNPPDSNAAALANLPSQIDPRGFLTFGVAGIGVLLFAWLFMRGSVFSRPLTYLAFLSGILLVIIYLGRLIVLDPSSPLILGPAAVEGLIVNPLFLIWIGWVVRKEPAMKISPSMSVKTA